MDILPTQVYEDDSFMPTQQLCDSLPHAIKQEELKIGTLKIGTVTYPIKQGITKIGRHPECNIIIYDQTVSKLHAEIEVNSNESWICDLKSSNKTKLNSSVLRPGRYYELKGGSVIEFGMVRAVYSVLGAMDESLVPETPMPSRARNQKIIIPGTPDTSMNYSSTSEDNVSTIPGTQAEDGDSVFRRPSAPARSSASIRKSYLPDSSIEDSMNDSRCSSASGKENSDERRVSIHDIETQKTFDSQKELSDDIHDVETQKIWLGSPSAAKQSHEQTDIHDMETQHEDVETELIVTDIHDVETQHDVDIHDLSTPEKTEVQDASVEGDGELSTVEKGQTEEAELTEDVSIAAEKSEIKGEESCTNAVDSTNSEQLENDQGRSQDCLELSIVTNFDDECSDLDRSNNLPGSQNLLGDLINSDDPANESGSTGVSPLKSFANNNETTEKSSDDENIFDVPTQANADNQNVLEGVTERVDYPFKASLMEDDSDDDTDQEGVFQRYSRIASQDSSQGLPKSQLYSDDSDTDEEGRFTAMAAKEKRATSLSFEVQQDKSEEAKNDVESSRDSLDLFDVATQQINLKDSPKGQGDVSKNSADFDTPTQVIEVNIPGDILEKGSVDFDTPTQVIDINPPVNVTEKGSVDFDTPTQVIDINPPVNVTEKGSVDFDTPTQVIDINPPVNVTEEGSVDFDTPTQVIDINPPINVTEKGCVDFDTPTQVIDINPPVNVTEKGSVDFDTPTQVIDINPPVNVTEKGSVDFDTPTQVIDINPPVNVTEEGSVDFDTPTQVIDINPPVNVTEKGSVDFDTPTQVIDINPPVNVTEKGSVDFDTPTQVIDINPPINVTEKGSVDLDTPTQVIDINPPVNVTEKGSVNFDAPTQLIEMNEYKSNVTEKGSVNFDTPTQLIEMNEYKSNVVEEDAKVDEDDLIPTQILPTSELSRNVRSEDKDKDEDQTDYDTPTQIIGKSVPIYNEPSSNDSEQLNPHLVEELSIEDIDYEMAPTQLLRDVEEKKKGELANNKKKSRKSKKVNLDDTLERNLNEMFDDVNENIEDDLPQMSTQVLTNVLESPQSKEEITDLTIDEELPGCSNQKTPPRRTRLSRSTKPEELELPEPVVETAESPRGNKNVAKELSRGDEVCLTSVGPGQSERIGILDSDEDIMAGLPEVRISGTLSNPASPTSSTEFRLTTRRMKSKSNGKKAESKKKRTPKKTTRKSVACTSAENNQSPKLGRLRSAALSRTFHNFDTSRVPVTIYESDDDIVDEIIPANRTSSRKSKESGSLQTKPNPLHEEVRRSPSIQESGRTRGSGNENLDSSSVFQVVNEALIATKAEPVRQTAAKASRRAVKRSLSSTDISESSDAKKRKEDITGNTSVVTKGRKSTRGAAAPRSSSANILDYVTRRYSPVLGLDGSQKSVSNSKESITTKQLRIKIIRLSSDTPTRSLSPLTPTRSPKEDDRASVKSFTSNSSKAENDKTTTVETRRGRSTRATSKRRAEDASSQIGEESQEVEMIMNSWVTEQNIINGKKQEETNENTKTVERKSARKRAQTNSTTSEEMIENTSSEVCESDNAYSETSTSKAKRATVSRNTPDVDNTTPNESTKAVGRRGAKKREKTNASPSEGITENIYSSEEVCESDNGYSETSTSKAKRATVSRNTTNDDNTVTNESTKAVGRRGAKKREKTNASPSEEITENIYSSEEVCESDNVYSETSTSKAKRATVSRNTPDVDNTATNESTKAVGRRGAKKREKTNASPSEEITENISSEEVCESDNVYSETSTSKAKRATVSRNTPDVDDTATNESTKAVGRRGAKKREKTNENISSEVCESDNAYSETSTSKAKRATVSRNTTNVDNTATIESTIAVGRRGARKRGKTNASPSEEITENIYSSEEVCESDNAYSETSTSNAKRATVPKNTTNVDNTATVESTIAVGRRGTRKRGKTNASPSEEITENIYSSEEVCESDNTGFETSTSKAKRATVPKNTTDVDNTATNESTKAVGKRGARKRGHTNASTSEETMENTSSEVCESDNTYLEMSTSKAKRARVSKNTTDVDNTAANETTTRGRRKGRQTSRLTPSVTDSSLELLRTPVNKTVNRTEVAIEETTPLPTSTMSTPSRSRSLNASFASSSPYKVKHRILFTGITNNYGKLLSKLGSTQVEDPTTCTVLVTDKVRRTFKFLCALAQAVPIVSVNWLVESEKAGHFTELDNYMLKDPAAEAKFGFRLRGSLEKAKKQKLLAGYTIVLTPNVAPPPLPELKSIISSCGGKPLVRPPSSWPQNSIIISREEDIANAKKFLAKAPKTVTIQSIEFILTGILRQEVDFVKYKLS